MLQGRKTKRAGVHVESDDEVHIHKMEDLQDVTFGYEDSFLSPPFITVQDGSDLTPRDPSHNCKEDHVKAGTTIRWQLRYSTKVQTMLQGLQLGDLLISLSPSRIDGDFTSILDVHLDVDGNPERVTEVTENRVRPFLHDQSASIILISCSTL